MNRCHMHDFYEVLRVALMMFGERPRARGMLITEQELQKNIGKNEIKGNKNRNPSEKVINQWCNYGRTASGGVSHWIIHKPRVVEIPKFRRRISLCQFGHDTSSDIFNLYVTSFRYGATVCRKNYFSDPEVAYFRQISGNLNFRFRNSIFRREDTRHRSQNNLVIIYNRLNYRSFIKLLHDGEPWDQHGNA